MLTEVAFLTCRVGGRVGGGEREFLMTAPEFMKDLRKSSRLGFGVYSWLQSVDLVSRHDTSEV